MVIQVDLTDWSRRIAGIIFSTCGVFYTIILSVYVSGDFAIYGNLRRKLYLWIVKHGNETIESNWIQNDMKSLRIYLSSFNDNYLNYYTTENK